MDIVIEEPLNHFALKIYQGSRWRYPTMTDVKFLDNQHIVAAHRYGCKVYVIHIDEENKRFTIIDSIQLMHKNRPYQTESFTIVDNTITTSPTSFPDSPETATPRYKPVPSATTAMISTPVTSVNNITAKPIGLPSMRAAQVYSPPDIG